ncbi:MAG: hypothetical protein QMD50_01790 [Patescibacteria group bacterium]|nr:hypothetical protein [Patescibacteria group bacterium]
MKRLLLILFCFVGINPIFAQQKSLIFFESAESKGEMRKYYGKNSYQKGFNWDAYIAQEFQIIKYKKHEFWGGVVFQPVIAKSYDRKIRVSGQVYLINLIYHLKLKENLNCSFVISHISTHITQDITNPFYMDLPPLPKKLLGDANVVGVGIKHETSWINNLPINFSFGFQPFDIIVPEFWNGKWYDRPLYFSIEPTLWHSCSWRLTCRAESELSFKGRSVAKLETRLELMRDKQKNGRFQIFAQRFFYTDEIGSNPRFGFFPTEFALGWRVVFEY